MRFEENVFINCPFDEDYFPLLRPLLYTTIYLGFCPRIALERKNSGEPRIEKIVELIEESKYGIHDLSRIKARKKGEYFRLNMPFELGIDVGCSAYGRGALAGKEVLILETEPYRYQAALSDLSGSDIEQHGDRPIEVVTKVRNWLAPRSTIRSNDGPSKIWASFNEFMAYNDADLVANGHSRKEIAKFPIGELIERMTTWVGISVD